MSRFIILTEIEDKVSTILEDTTVPNLLENFSEDDLKEISHRVTEMLVKINKAELIYRKSRRRVAKRLAAVEEDKD